MRRIVLASASPRRKEILEKFGLKFEIMTSEVEEEFDKYEDPAKVAESLALEKGLDVSKKCNKGDIVIAADTIVYYDSILGKPRDREDAFNILKSLSGKTHKVITGFTILEVGSEKKVVDHEVTSVKFRDLNDEKIERYLNTQEYVDKAGAYGIQGYGEILVESISGSFSNVVGLPSYRVDKYLEDNFNLKLL